MSSHRRIGLIVNPRSHAVPRRGAMLEAAALDMPDACFLRLDDFSRLDEFACYMARNGVDKVFVEGGDGTLLAVLSACLAPEAGFEVLPDFAILPGGSTNLAARSFGFRGRTPGQITRRILALADEVAEPVRERHRALRVESTALPRPAIGFVLATGALARAMLYTLRTFFGDNGRGSRAVALAILRFLVAPTRYCDTDGQPVLRPSDLSVQGPGLALEGTHTLCLLSSLPRLSLGLAPFWGVGDGPVRMTHAAWPVHGLRRAIIRILFRLTGPGLAAYGLSSYRAERLELCHEDPVLIDGEMIPRADDGRLRVSATEPLAFLR